MFLEHNVFKVKTKIMIDHEIRTVKHHRWMRCINADNLEDYVDIAIGSGSNNKNRQDVLEIADFIGGDWRGSVFEKGIRIQYDYYYLYARNKDGVFNEADHPGEYIGATGVGCHRNGDFVRVNISTNEIVEQIKWIKWSKELDRAAK